MIAHHLGMLRQGQGVHPAAEFGIVPKPGHFIEFFARAPHLTRQEPPGPAQFHSKPWATDPQPVPQEIGQFVKDLGQVGLGHDVADTLPDRRPQSVRQSALAVSGGTRYWLSRPWQMPLSDRPLGPMGETQCRNLFSHPNRPRLMLHLERYGPEDGRPLLIAHGLFGSARNWGVLAKRLSATRPVVAVDMRNHGDSPRHATQSYGDMAQDLAEVVEHIGGPANVLGHSMGGKAAMVLALARPDLVARLIVADIAPVAYAHSQTHLIDAMRALDLNDVTRRGEADARLADVVEEATVRAFLLQSLDLKTRPATWRLNLDTLAREMPQIVGWPDPSGVFAAPTLFLSGGESDYVTRAHRPVVRALFPKARFAKIPGAGHWLHAEKPREFEAAVEVFLSA